jgi:hypothetical protein
MIMIHVLPVNLVLCRLVPEWGEDVPFHALGVQQTGIK